MQRLVETVTHQFREAMFDQSESGDATTELRTLIGIYFDVIADLQPVNRARLVLWADAVANPDDGHPKPRWWRPTASSAKRSRSASSSPSRSAKSRARSTRTDSPR